MTIDKLEGIRGDLVRTDDDWQEWDFPRLTEALRKWTERNPIKSSDKVQEKYTPSRGKSFQARQEESKPHKSCIYCEETDHKSVNCQKVVSIADRKKQLSLKQLCFNCTGSKHRVAECKSRSGCHGLLDSESDDSDTAPNPGLPKSSSALKSTSLPSTTGKLSWEKRRRLPAQFYSSSCGLKVFCLTRSQSEVRYDELTLPKFIAGYAQILQSSNV